MSQATWEANDTRSITIVTTQNCNFTAYYTVEGTANFQAIPGTFTKTGDMYYLNTSFSTTGNYVVRIVDANSNIADVYFRLKVVAVGSEDLIGVLHASLDSYTNKSAWGQDVASEVIAVQDTVDSIEASVLNTATKVYTPNEWYTVLDGYTGKDDWKAAIPDYTTRFDNIDTATVTIINHVDGLPAGQSSILSAVTGLNFDTTSIASDVWNYSGVEGRILTEGYDNTDRIKLNTLSNYDDSTLNAKLNTLVARDPYSEASIHNALDTYTNKDDWKASSVDLSPVTNAIAALNDLSLLEIEGSTVLAKEATLGVISAAISQIPTTDSVADLTPVLNAIAGLNDVTPAEVRAAFNTVDFKDKNTETEIHTWLDSYAGKDDWKTDTSGLPDEVWGKVV